MKVVEVPENDERAINDARGRGFAVLVYDTRYCDRGNEGWVLISDEEDSPRPLEADDPQNVGAALAEIGSSYTL